MMPLESEIHALERFDCAGTRALSLYLNTDVSRASGWNLRAQIENLFGPKQAALIHDKEGYSALQSDIEAALDALKFKPPPRAAAVFVCSPRLLYAVPLRFAVVPQAHWDDHLHLEPLLAQLDEHERALVVLVDQRRARIFRTFLGHIEQIADFTDDVPGRHRAAGASQQKFGGSPEWSVRMGYNAETLQRHHEWHIRQHLDHVIERVTEIQRYALSDRVLLSAPEDLLAEFLRLVPRRWRRLVETGLHVPMTASPAEVLEATETFQEQVERRVEVELVRSLVELDGAHSARGPAAVAEAIANQEVLTFIYAADARLAGAYCTSCGWLMPDPAGTACARCQEEVVHTDDLIDVFIDRVLKQNGRVEEVRGEAAAALAQMEGLAVVRRFVSAGVTA